MHAATLRLMGKSVEDIHANDRRVMETGESIRVEEPYTGADGVCRTFRSTKSRYATTRDRLSA